MAPVVRATPAASRIAGSLQSELGCGATGILPALRRIWRMTPATTSGSRLSPSRPGGWNIRPRWTIAGPVNYGANATLNGPNIGLVLGADTVVKFYYDDKTHWVTDNQNSVIAVAPGSFQSELGCPGDWQPDCLRSWLQDPDGDGIYAFSTTALPAGSYEGKVAINEGWDENYGAGGVPGGPNIGFNVPADNAEMLFRYDPVTHILTIVAAGQSFPDNNVEWDGLRHDSRDALYRTPGGAVGAGTPVTLRLRTFHNDVTAVRARVFSVEAGAQTCT